MIELKAQVEGIQSRKDNTLKLTFGTQELKEGGKLFPLQNKLVTLGIAENELEPKDIEQLQEAKLSIEDVPNGKSKSQQYRSVLYIYWTQHDTGFDTFQSFYDNHYDKKINNVKSKLEQ